MASEFARYNVYHDEVNIKPLLACMDHCSFVYFTAWKSISVSHPNPSRLIDDGVITLLLKVGRKCFSSYSILNLM